MSNDYPDAVFLDLELAHKYLEKKKEEDHEEGKKNNASTHRQGYYRIWYALHSFTIKEE